MKKLNLIAFVLLFVFAIQAFGQKPDDERLLVPTSWLARNLKDVSVLHIGRDSKRYDEGHIPGAHFVAWKEIATMRDGVPNELHPVATLKELFTELGIGNTKRVVIYGDMQGLFAARAFFTLDYLGHGHRVSLLNGGLEKWKAEKRRTARETTYRRRANFIPNLRLEKVVTLDRVIDVSWVVRNLRRPRMAIVDARPNDYFTGAKKSKSNKRAGHIPGARSFYWMNNLVSKENPVMRSKGELRKMYESKGVTRTKKIVAYCQSGGQASHAYFTLRYLGYDVVMYDGSFGEWSNKEFTEVAVSEQ